MRQSALKELGRSTEASRGVGRSAAALFALLAGSPSHAVTPVPAWVDSYDADGQCYCQSTFDHGAGDLVIDTPAGARTAREVCDTIGPGPGSAGRPLYNDLQCGNGPPNGERDEDVCPGRVDSGEAGCSIIGPTWNLERWFPAPAPEPAPGPSPGIAAADADATLVPVGDARLAFEIETLDVIDDRWQRIDSTVTAADAAVDGDGPTADGASGGAYLELLPDLQRIATDPPADTTDWTVPGQGPRIAHDIDFPVAGRWRVALRARAHGTHDERVAVGLDGVFDDALGASGLCDAPGVWVWSDCGGDPAHVDVPTAGVHTLEIAGVDDGVELDRVVLERIGGVPIVLPTSTDSSSPADPTDPDDTASSSTAEPVLGEAVTVGAGVASIASGSALALCGLLALRLGTGRRRARTH